VPQKYVPGKGNPFGKYQLINGIIEKLHTVVGSTGVANSQKTVLKSYVYEIEMLFGFRWLSNEALQTIIY
jgi:hypothetical protein